MYAHSDSFEDYTGGVITDATAYPGITHVVALVGWGTDEASGLDYWAVRNSFGTYWGEQGFYRVQRGINAFNMEVEEEGRATQERGGMNDYERGACVKGAEVRSCFPKLSCRFFVSLSLSISYFRCFCCCCYRRCRRRCCSCCRRVGFASGQPRCRTRSTH